MDAMQKFKDLCNKIKADGQLIPRKHEMDNWAVDTHKLGDLIYQLSDGGYGERIKGPDFDVHVTWTNNPVLNYSQGDEAALLAYSID